MLCAKRKKMRGNCVFFFSINFSKPSKLDAFVFFSSMWNGIGLQKDPGLTCNRMFFFVIQNELNIHLWKFVQISGILSGKCSLCCCAGYGNFQLETSTQRKYIPSLQHFRFEMSKVLQSLSLEISDSIIWKHRCHFFGLFSSLKCSSFSLCVFMDWKNVFSPLCLVVLFLVFESFFGLVWFWICVYISLACVTFLLFFHLK